MGLLDKYTTRTPTVKKTLRNQCYDLDGAYGYFQDRVAEMVKDGGWTWVKEDKDGAYVEIRLHSMPLYWKVEPKLENGKQETVDIKDPEGNVLETRRIVYGHTKLDVGSLEEGKSLLQALADVRDDDFMSTLGIAAKALQVVDEQELPDIRRKAEMLYTESQWVKEYGPWDEKDEAGAKEGSRIYSKEKTNKMNQYKQTARRKLGYERAKVVVTGYQQYS